MLFPKAYAYNLFTLKKYLNMNNSLHKPDLKNSLPNKSIDKIKPLTSKINSGIVKSKNPDFVNIKHLSVRHLLEKKEITEPTIFFNTELANRNIDTIDSKSTRAIEFLNIRVNKLVKKVFIQDIIRIEASSNYSIIHIKNAHRTIISAKTLKYYMELIGIKNFISPHKSHFINKAFIKICSFKNKPCIKLTDNSIIPISRRKVKAVKRVLLNSRSVVL